MADFRIKVWPCATLLDLPPEITRSMMRESCLSMKDLANLSQTCSKLNTLIKEDCNDIWRFKHNQQWPQISTNVVSAGRQVDWRSECIHGVHIGSSTLKLLKEIWPQIYLESEVCYSHYAPFREMMGENGQYFFYMKDALMNIISGSNECSNLTLKYHAKQLLRFLRQEHLKLEWNVFRNLPQQEQLLERGATLVAQWCQPYTDITYGSIGAQLDSLAGKVLEHMKRTLPEHPVHYVSLQVRQQWKDKNLSNNIWDCSLCFQIIEAIGEVLYKEECFRANRETYHLISNSFINQVLEQRLGVPLTINLIVEGVGRRLGVRLDPWFRGYFVLLWKKNFQDNPNIDLWEDYYVDISNGYPFLSKANSLGGGSPYSCPFRASHMQMGSTSPIEVIERLAGSIEVAGRLNMRSNRDSAGLRSPLELLVVIDPENLDYVLHLARFYMLYNISVEQLADHVQKLIESGQFYRTHHAGNVLQMLKSFSLQPQNNQQVEPHTKDDRIGVLFAVGMTMKHLLFGYKCVITGWDPVCVASAEWKLEMGVHRLKFTDKQPFYNVMVEDGTCRYAAQENLEPLKEHQDGMALLTLTDVGRFFESYRGVYYEPNHMKQLEYPDDVLVRKQFYGPHAV